MKSFPLFFLLILTLFLAYCTPQKTVIKEPKPIKQEIVKASPVKPPYGIPAVYSGIHFDDYGKLYFEYNEEKYYRVEKESRFTLDKVLGNPKGVEGGIAFDFGDETLKGKLVYGLIPYGDSKHPYPVYFHSSAAIDSGRCVIDIFGRLRGRYDMIGWEVAGKGTIGYRLIDDGGNMLYDGRVSFKSGPVFEVDNTIIEGPFVNLLGPDKVTISFETNIKTICSIRAGGQTFSDKEALTRHEITLSGLKANTEYDYEVLYGNNSQQFSFKTAPEQGSRTAFSFAYASDCRAGNGGGERSLRGTNLYIMKKIMALATQQKAAFCQFTGDLVNGYSTDSEDINLQYANWKRAVEPYAHYLPVIAGMGNHEALVHRFAKNGGRGSLSIDKFPFATESAEAVFAQNFVNPQNGPASEDMAYYDPNKNETDFPPYDETVFYYTYDNVVMIVLNSDYFYAPSLSGTSRTSGNLHGYIMDNQLEWLEKTITMLEADENIDHIFVTQHTPAFPNGGHVGDDMWYRGNNDYRAYVAGKPLRKGIIERRDEYLDILVNKSKKVAAIFTGDEHNYCRTELGPDTPIYPENYLFNKIELTRTIHQINNGAAGAPYYAQEVTPWSGKVEGFTTQNALVLIDVNGKSLKMRVLNPDTLEEVDELVLRK